MQTIISSKEKGHRYQTRCPYLYALIVVDNPPKKHSSVRMSMKYVYVNVNGDVNAYGMYMGVSAIYGFHEIHRIHAFQLLNFLIAFFQHL